MKESYKASENMKTFFEKLIQIKKDIFEESKKNSDFLPFYVRLNEIIKENGK